jgi:hypothetical protein
VTDDDAVERPGLSAEARERLAGPDRPVFRRDPERLFTRLPDDDHRIKHDHLTLEQKPPGECLACDIERGPQPDRPGPGIVRPR